MVTRNEFTAIPSIAIAYIWHQLLVLLRVEVMTSMMFSSAVSVECPR